MTIIPCNIRSKEGESNAYPIINAITSDTTPEAFDHVVKMDPNYQLSHGGRCAWNALGKAAIEGNTPLIHHIVQKGGKQLLPLGNFFGWTPLYCAANCEDKKKGFLAAKALLFLGANINTATCTGCDDSNTGETPRLATPLWAAAVKTQNIKLVKLLLIHGGAIHPDTEEGIRYPNEIEERRPLTLINPAKRELEQEAETRNCFQVFNHLAKTNKLPKTIIQLIFHYLNGEMAITRPEAPRIEDTL